jgi:hypothetical protein
MERAAAPLARGHDNIAAFGREYTHGGSVDGIKEDPLYTAGEQSDATPA